jgi:hypothetical protein
VGSGRESRARAARVRELQRPLGSGRVAEGRRLRLDYCERIEGLESPSHALPNQQVRRGYLETVARQMIAQTQRFSVRPCEMCVIFLADLFLAMPSSCYSRSASMATLQGGGHD